MTIPDYDCDVNTYPKGPEMSDNKRLPNSFVCNLANHGTDYEPMLARELIEARKTIDNIKADRQKMAEEVERLDAKADAAIDERDLFRRLAYCRLDEPGKTDIPWADIARKEKGRGDNMKQWRDEAVAERDAAINLSRQIDDALMFTDSGIGFPDLRTGTKIVNKLRTFLHGYRTASAPFDRCPEPAKCSHEWRHDEDLGHRQKCCDKCGKVETLCGGCDEVPGECRCEPLPPANPDNALHEFPFDRATWHYRPVGTHISYEIGHSLHSSEGKWFIEAGDGMVAVADLRTWERSADLVNWEACPNG
jgi:hypothetical protein